MISDELNHASIIDGVRLCKAKRFRYKNNDMEDLESQLNLPRVPVIISTRPSTPQCSGVPRPVFPTKPTAWLSAAC